MSLTGMDGFDADPLLSVWVPWAVSGARPRTGLSYVSNGGIAGGGCMRMGAALGNSGLTLGGQTTQSNSSGRVNYLAMYVRFSPGFTFTDAVASALVGNPFVAATVARVNAAGQLLMYDYIRTAQGALVATVTPPNGINLLDGRWHSFNFTFDLTSTPTIYQIWIDEVLALNLSFTTANPDPTGSVSISTMPQNNGASGASYVDIDDFLIWDNDNTIFGNYPQAFVQAPPLASALNRYRICLLNPDADVADAGPSMTLVGGATKHAILSQPYSALTQATYLSAVGTTAFSAGIGYGSLPSSTLSIPLVQSVAFVESIQTGASSLFINVTIDGIDTSSYQMQLPPNAHNVLSILFAHTNQNGAGAAWTVTGVANAADQLSVPTPDVGDGFSTNGRVFKSYREAVITELAPVVALYVVICSS